MFARVVGAGEAGNLRVRKGNEFSNYNCIRIALRRSAADRNETPRGMRTLPGYRRVAAFADGSRLAPSVSARGMFIVVHLLHAGAPPRRRRGIQPHRGGAYGPPLPVPPAGLGRRLPDARLGYGCSRRISRRRTTSQLTAAARHKSKRDVELLVATVAPRPLAATVLRRVPVKPQLAPAGIVSTLSSPTATNHAPGAGAASAASVPRTARS